METQSLYRPEVLEKTFSILREAQSPLAKAHEEKLAGILNLLSDLLSPEAIRRAYYLVAAEYAILPDRRIDALKERVQAHFGEMAEETAQKVLSWIVFGTENGFAEGAAGRDAESNLLDQQIRKSYGMDQEMPQGEEVESAHGRFGYDPTNPIPVDGVDRINDYFARLRTETGESISYERTGSLSVEDLPFPVDQYEIKNQAGKVIATLFVYAYHGKVSGKVPEGFRRVGADA